MSSSDTEVILALYDKYGEKCLRYLRGMFSFIIWDQQEKKLFVARDRFGIKPLYWTKVTNSFLFSSELEGLLASNGMASFSDVLTEQEVENIHHYVKARAHEDREVALGNMEAPQYTWFGVEEE